MVVELDGSVEGFVPVAQLGLKEGTPQDMFKEGQQIPLSVVEFDQSARRITLSVEAYYKGKDQSEMDSFYAKQTEEAASSGGALAEALGQAGIANSDESATTDESTESSAPAEPAVAESAPAPAEPAAET